MGKNKKKKGKGKGKGGETGEKGTMPLEVLNSCRRSQHMGPLLDSPAARKKALLDSPAAMKKALLDSPPSSDKDSRPFSLTSPRSRWRKIIRLGTLGNNRGSHIRHSEPLDCACANLGALIRPVS
jgi:hypothetical protein